ncbi:MAG TPA: exodeoxyribonuclease V subunit gamma [Candidatus Omnitrophota bacterium]|nr:exodeoxyribonuclease V subunit gamma [Candidatus Omnitrophota bacterium]
MKRASKSSILELIARPAGFGKTDYCIAEFRKAIFHKTAGLIPKAYFILPNKEHADRIADLLLRRVPGETKVSAGILAPAIVTINEFIHRTVKASVFRTPGDLLTKKLIRDILQDPALSYFSGTDRSGGIPEILGNFIAEAKSAFLDGGEFEERVVPLGGDDPVFRKKLADLGRILAEYEKKLRGLNLCDPSDFIRTFVRSPFFPGPGKPLDLVILDGFYHFSKAQLEFIRKLTGFSERIIVTVTMDSDPARQSVFDYPRKTRQALLAMGFTELRAGFKTNRRVRAPALGFLEENLFKAGALSFGKPQRDVQIFEAANATNEIEMIAREIRKLYRTEKYHFSDFCVILRTIGAYESLIRTVFARFDIPVAVHERKKLKQNSLVRAVMAWIRLLQNDWRREDLEAVIQSSYFGFSPGLSEALGEAAAGNGIHAGRKNWETLFRDLPEPFRGEAETLLAWQDRFFSESSPAAVRKLLFEFVREYRLLERVSAREAAAREDYQAYRAFCSVTDELTLHGSRDGQNRTGFSRYCEELAQAVDLTLFSVKERGKNRVQVYDAAFAVQKEYEAVFVAGLLEKNFPKQIYDDPVLKDEERRLLNQKEEYFEERFSRIAGERYFFYIAVTRAREKLYLTYPIFDLEGHELLPSFYVEEVKKCLGGDTIPVRTESLGDIVPGPESACRREDFFKILIRELFSAEADSERDEVTARLWNACFDDPEFRAVLEQIRRSGRPAEIRDPEILKWFRETQRGPFSASRLQEYATCPFKFFAANVLKLEPQRKPINVLRLGTILHAALERFFGEMIAGGDSQNWLLIRDPERALKRAAEIVEDIFRTNPFRGEKKYRVEISRQSLLENIRGFLERERQRLIGRKCKPRYVELAFGLKRRGAPSLDYLVLPGEDGQPIPIEGKIDRVDHDPRSNIACVVDYKLGKSKLDLLTEHLEKGIELQLIIYLLAVRDLLGYEPAAGELYPITVPEKRGGIYQARLMRLTEEDCPQTGAVLDPERFEALLSEAKKWIAKYVRGIQSGNIRVHSKECRLCEFNHLCRFEIWRLIYQDRETVWQKPEKQAR